MCWKYLRRRAALVTQDWTATLVLHALSIHTKAKMELGFIHVRIILIGGLLLRTTKLVIQCLYIRKYIVVIHIKPRGDHVTTVASHVPINALSSVDLSHIHVRSVQ